MRFVPPERWPLALGAYALAGLGLGFAPEPARSLFTALGLDPRFAIAAVVNLALPLAAVAVAAWYPRVWTALAGGVLLGAGFTVSRLLLRDPRFWTWTPGLVGNTVHPIVVAASVGCAAAGAVTAALLRGVRRVGIADAHLRCARCGYLLVGVAGPCPECGAPLTAAGSGAPP